MKSLETPSHSFQQNQFTERRVSVHALGQFVFCPRAAVLALESGDETDVDEPGPRLDYVPNYDLRLIAEEWSKQLWWFRRVLLLMAISLVLLLAGALVANRLLFYPALVIFICTCIWLGRRIPVLWTLRRRIHVAMHSRAREPSPELDRVEPVSWWDMLRAGFEPKAYASPFRHPQVPLEGSPWRVLERGSLRIPVIRSGGKKLGSAPGTVYEKHRIRLAAYALLLEATPHAKSPYGIVLLQEDHNGLAVPLHQGGRSHLAKLITVLRVTLFQSQAGLSQPEPPTQKGRCAGCLLGEPKIIEKREAVQLMRQGKEPLFLQHVSGRVFHCACGDRFRSAPPHRKSIKLNLISRVQ